jgi:hypothetical protein
VPADSVVASATEAPREIEFSWATEIARATGIAMHNILETVDIENWESWYRAAGLYSRSRV